MTIRFTRDFYIPEGATRFAHRRTHRAAAAGVASDVVPSPDPARRHLAVASQTLEKKQMVNFKCSPADEALIRRIVDRGYPMLMEAWSVTPGRMRKMGADVLSLTMDITACHCNGCPLDLTRFLAADDFNFAHDFAGIHRHIDRTTGKLGDCFLPRFHAREATDAH